MNPELQEGKTLRSECEAARIGISAENEGNFVNLSDMELVRSPNTDVIPGGNTVVLESEFNTAAESALKRRWDEMEDGKGKDVILKSGYSTRVKSALERSWENIEDNGDEHFYKAVKEMTEGREPVLVAMDLRKARKMEEVINKNFCFGRAVKTIKVHGLFSYCKSHQFDLALS